MNPRRFLHLLCLIPALLLAAPAAVPAESKSEHPWQLSKSDFEHAKNAKLWSGRNRWDEALAHAKRAKDPLIYDIFLWMKYANGGGTSNFKELAAFLHSHPEWPDRKMLERRAEETLTYNTSTEDILAWFEDSSLERGYREPLTAKGKQLLGEALLSKAEKSATLLEESNRLIRASWVEGKFAANEQVDFLKRHGRTLRKEDHVQRISRLLWNQRTTEARRVLPMVDKDEQRLFQSRIALIDNAPGLDAIIKNIPPSMQDDPGLIFDRASWRANKKKYDSLNEFLKEYISSTKDYGEKWWKIKRRAFWDHMESKQYKAAYEIISHHGMQEGSEFADGEWLSGWVALRFLNEPQKAYKHFYKLFQGVVTPLSLSRAAYWSGRAAQANGNLKIARGWFEVAAKYPNTFYGQLSLLRLNTRKIDIPPQPEPTAEDFERYLKNTQARAAYILHNLHDYRHATKFIRAATTEAKTVGEAVLVTRMGKEMKQPEYGVAAAKEMSKSGMVVMESHYPTPRFKHVKTGKIVAKPEEALVYAIILQESMFDLNAKSPVGAMGLMQLMPLTARAAARREHVQYSRAKLLTDANYNATLGSHYLNEVVDGFDGSYILGIASYNAGPSNARKWMKLSGDPRKLKTTDEIVDWIESIPFSETRNYVMRVLENLQMFRVALDPNAELSLDKDLQRGK
jgi:soluble lytic murein transglycosylase